MANKRYDQFPAGNPKTDRIILHADASTGTLEKSLISELSQQISIYQPFTTAYKMLGSPIINFAATFTYGNANVGMNLNGNNAYYLAVLLPDCTVTGVAYLLSQSGVFTANNFNGFGLYSFSGNVLTQVAVTANNGNFFKVAAVNWAQAPFAATATISAGLYFIAMLWNYSALTTSVNCYATSWDNGGGNRQILYTGKPQLYQGVSPSNTLASTVTLTLPAPQADKVPVLAIY